MFHNTLVVGSSPTSSTTQSATTRSLFPEFEQLQQQFRAIPSLPNAAFASSRLSGPVPPFLQGPFPTDGRGKQFQLSRISGNVLSNEDAMSFPKPDGGPTMSR